MDLCYRILVCRAQWQTECLSPKKERNQIKRFNWLEEPIQNVWNVEGHFGLKSTEIQPPSKEFQTKTWSEMKNTWLFKIMLKHMNKLLI